VSVSGVSGGISNIRVTVTNLTHTFPGDIDMVLFGPTGAHSIIFTDAIGGTGGVTGRNYTFEIGATALPTTGFPASGTYGVVNGGSWSGSGTPSTVTSANLGNFLGTNANGTWSLYLTDDGSGDSGSIGSWSLEITTGAAVSTYTWSPATYLSSTSVQNPTATAVVTSVPYTVTVTSATGCSATGNVTVTPSAPITAASITGTLSYCAGGSTTLTAVPADGGAPFTYLWSPGGQTTASIVVNSPGSYSCQVTDNCGGSVNTGSVTVVENPLPAPVISPATPVNFCVSGTLTSSIATGNVWSPGGATTQSINVTSDGTYSVTVTDGNGCVGTSTPVVVTISAQPNAVTITPPAPAALCQGGSVALSASGAAISAVATQTSGTISVAIPDVNATGINNAFAVSGIPGGAIIDSVIVTLNITHGFVEDLIVNLEAPNGQIINLAGGVAGATGSAYTGTRISSNDSRPALLGATAGHAGTYRADKRTTGFQLAPATPPTTATWSSLYSVPNGTWRIRVIDDESIGSGTLTNWQIKIAYSIPVTYSWSPGAGLNTTIGPNVTASPNAPGQTYTATATNGACTSTANVNVVVNPLPIMSCPANSTVCINDAAFALSGASPVGGTYSGTGVSGGNFDPAIAGAGTHTITYSFTDGNTCTNTCTFSVTVDPDTDGDGICDPQDSCPTFPGQNGDFCDANPGPGYTLGQITACACVPVVCTTNLNIIFNPDGVTDIQWEIRQQGSNVLVQAGGGVYPATPEYSEPTCLPNGNYYLVVTSNTGGIVQNGYQGGYRLRTSGGLMVIDNRNNFLSGSTSQIAGGEGFSIPLSADRTIFTSSDKLDWQNNEYIYATDNPAVTATYGVDNVNNGYQMWWYNPNGGYSFRRFQNHNTSNGLPASATRACGFRINGWSGNQLQDGTLYNVKVRSMVNGVYGNWGAATRFRIDAARAQCPLTNLMDLPGNQFVSCGGTRALGTSQPHLVHARPVKKLVSGAWVNANRYQFRFISENTIIKTSNTNQYWVYTGSAPSLQAGITYEVEVRASFDNGATWCDAAPGLNPFAPKWGKVCLLTISGAAQGGNQNLATTTNNAEVGLYPNPNNGQQLTLSLSQVAAGTKTVTVDILDTFGKRVSARTIAVNDTFVNTVLELNGELAAGMYLVNITAGDATYTERLVIQP
jgi:subtilisin-like proprotein convertase family protein